MPAAIIASGLIYSNSPANKSVGAVIKIDIKSKNFFIKDETKIKVFSV